MAAAITLVDSGTRIEVQFDTTHKLSIPKKDLKIRIKNSKVLLFWDSSFENKQGRPWVELDPDEITSPTVANAAALYALLTGWIATESPDEGGGGSATYVGLPSNGDFTTAYTAATQITFSDLPSDVVNIVDENIEIVRQINTSGEVVATYEREDAAMTVAANVLTVTGADFTNTDTFVVFTNIPRPSGGGGASADADYKIGSWDGTVTYASTTTLTLAGAYPTINYNAQVVFIKFVDDTLGTSDVFVNGQNGVVITHSGGTLTIAGAGTPFAATNDYEVGINATPVGTDIDADAIKTSVQNMEAGHYTDPEHIDEDNEGAQNDTKYTRTVVEMGSYKYLSGSYLITADDTHNDVTLRIWATNKSDYSLPDEDTAIADSDMIFDVSEEVLGNAAGITVNDGSVGDNFCIDIPSKYYAYVIELQYDEDNTAAPANAADLYIIRY